MKKVSLVLCTFLSSILLTGCVPNEKQVLEKSSKYTEVKVVDNGCGIKLSEASDMAYNNAEKVLYIVGDKGNFYQCSVNQDNDIVTLDFISSKTITHDFTSIDAEGLSINTKTNELILSTEGSASATGVYPITKYGVINGKYDLPNILKTAKFKDSNKKFEAVTYHNDLGILTAAEQPINGKKTISQTIYDMYGGFWNFEMENYDQASVTALETTSDGNFLVLERAENQTVNFYITIKKLIINDACKNKNTCSDEVLYKALWEGGNFEGMTKINDTYLIVNDGQGSFDTIFKAFKIK